MKEKGFIHVSVLVAIFALLFASSIIPVKRNYNDGKSNVAGVYLAKDGDSGSSGSSGGGGSSGGSDSGSHDSGSSSGGSSGSGSSGSSGGSGDSNSVSGSSGGSSQTASTSQATPKPSKVETKEVKKEVENELRSSTNKEVHENQRVEIKTTPEKIKSEIRQGNLRIKFEIENGKVKIETKVKEAEGETELENEAENEAVKEVETELEKQDVKIATAPGQIALVNKKVGALLTFPLSVNPTTRQLTVTTPAGSKVVAVLPQKAVGNMLAAHVIDDVTSEKINNSLASIPEMVKLEVKNGALVYQIKGTKTHKLLGFIPLKTGVEAFVSAENGQVVETNQSLLGRILNRLAP